MWIPNITQVRQLRQRFSQSFGIFDEVFSVDMLTQTVAVHPPFYRRCLLDPVITIYAWVSQVMDFDRSCRKAMSRVYAYLGETEAIPKCADTGAYCKARQRLCKPLLDALYHKMAKDLEQEALPLLPGCAGRILLVDGTTVLLPDTAENQMAYPQHSNQKEGVGFPLLQLVVLFSLNTGAVLKALTDIWKCAEVTLFRAMFDLVEADDLFIGDRHFASYADLALLKDRGADGLFRLHQRRKIDWRCGRKLGRYDRLLTWQKPISCPKGLDKDLYLKLPDTLTVRILRYDIDIPGYRSKRITIVTTLTDPLCYPAHLLARLFGCRWLVEIDLRHLKTTMDMDMLSCKTPEMVRKELAIYFLAYNLICAMRLKAADHTRSFLLASLI